MEDQPPTSPAVPAVSAADLVGTEWRLTDYLEAGRALVPVPPDVHASAVFADDVVTGSTGCNRYHGACRAAGDVISIERLATTMMACGPAQTAVERAFVAGLEATVSYRIKAGTLELADAAGSVSLRFRAAAPRGLVGTRWIATGINNGRGGVASVVPGVEVSAVFAGDGSLAGSGGCNHYSGTYTVDGGGLVVEPVAGTLRACLEPPGVGEQETSYFAALARVATWSSREDRLELRGADGALQVEYRAATEGDAERATLEESLVGRGPYELFACDPALADTAAFCAAYGFDPADSANTIVVAGKSDPPAYAACVVLATHRLDVNRVVRSRLGTRKASFASPEETREITGHEIGGVTAFGLPAGLPLLVDAAVMARERIVLGGGSRSWKVIAPPSILLTLPGVEVVDGLANPAPPRD